MKPLKYFKLIPLFFTLGVALTSCSKKLDEQVHHTGVANQLVQENVEWSFPKATEQAMAAAVAKDAEVGKALTTAGVQVSNLRMRMSTGNNFTDLAPERRVLAESIHKSILPLEPVALNPSFTGDTVLSATQNFRTIFRRYTEGLGLLLKTDPNYVREKGLLKAFWKVSVDGCDEQLQGCRSLSLIQSSSQAAYLLEQFAWETDGKIQDLKNLLVAKKISEDEHKAMRVKLIKRKFNAMKLALKTQNSGEDIKERVGLLYLMSHAEYGEIPEAQRSDEDNLQSQLMNDRLTAQLSRRMADPAFRAEMAPYVKGKNIWQRFSLRDQRGQRASFGSVQAASDLIKVSCRYYFDSANLEDTIRSSLGSVDAVGADGFLKEIDAIKNGENSMILANMRANSDFAPDRILFLVDQVYRGHWDMNIANECLKSFRANMSVEKRKAEDLKLIGVIQDYIRIEIIKRVIATNKFMSLIFRPMPGQRKLSSREIFFQAIDDSRGLKNDWEGMITKISFLDNFTKSALGETRSDLQSEQYKRLNHMLLGLRNNIKLLAVYPNMLVLSYYLAAKNFSVDIPTWYGGSIELNAEMIINWILGEDGGDKSARPLFDFGNDSSPIQTFENLYSLFYALKTETFSTFDSGDQKRTADANDEKPISDTNFFAEVTKRYINKELLAITNDLKDLEDTFNTSENYRQVQKICNAEIQAKKTGRAGNGYQLEMSMPNLVERTFVPFDSRSTGQPLNDLYGYQLTTAQQTIRGQIYRKYLFISAMLEILEDHWRGQLEMTKDPALAKKLAVGSAAEVEKKLEEVRGNFNSLHDSIRRYQKFTLFHHRNIGSCLYTFSETEVDQQFKLFGKEVEYLKVVYAALNEFQQRVQQDPTKQAELEMQYSAAVNGKTSAQSTPLMVQVSQLAKAWFETSGDIDAFDSITLDGGFTYSRWNMLLRMRKNLQEINPNIAVSKPTVLSETGIYTNARDNENRFSVVLTKGVSEPEFIRSVLSTVAAKKFVDWTEKTRQVQAFTNRIDLMSEYFLNDAFGVFDTSKRHCLVDKASASCKDDSVLSAPITLKEIVDDVFRVANLVHIKPEEETILRYLNQRTKFSKSSISYFFLDAREEPHSFLEYIYKKISGVSGTKQELLTQARSAAVTFNAILSTGNAADIDDRNAAQDSRELIFLSEYDSVRKTARKLYRPIVLNSFERVRNLENIAKCLSQQVAASPGKFRYLYELDLNSTAPRAGKWLSLNEDRSRKKTEMLESRLIEDFQNYMRDFDKETKSMYSARPGDADYGAAINKLNCDELLK